MRITDDELRNLAQLAAMALEGNADAREWCAKAWRALDSGIVGQRDLARALGCTPRHVRNLVAKGAIPEIRAGASPRYDVAACIAALSTR